MRESNTGQINDPVVARIDELLEAQKKTQKQLVEYLGLTNGGFTKWRYHGGKSYINHIDQIVDFLGVTPNELLRGLKTDIYVSSLTTDEIELTRNYHVLTVDARKVISADIKLLAGMEIDEGDNKKD